MSYTTTATATNSTGNTILVESTDNLFSGLPIVFSGVAFGGIIAGAAYYVGTVDYEYNLITVSTLPGGTAFILTTDSGSMTATFSQGGQQIIDTDPPGVPLNTAFNETNLNFDQIFAAGPVGSNIQIKDNTISTINTNGNLVLKPNGVGVVQSKVNIVPDSTRIRSLGAPTARWLNIYGWNANIASNVSIGGAINISGPANIGGDLYVDGNLTVEGTTTTIDSTVVDIKDKNITLAFGSPNAQVANGGGITIAGANAQMYYNYAGNNWTFNLPVATANIQFPDGSVLDTANTAHIGDSPLVKADGNLWFNSDDGRGYIKYNDQWIEFCPPIIPNPATYLGNLTIDGAENSTLYFPPGGAIVFGDDTVQTTAFNGNSINFANVASSIIPAANVTYSLGNSTNWWANAWFGSNTIYIGGVPIGVDGDTLTVDGANVITATNLPLATNSTPGAVALGNGFTLNSSNQVTTSSLYNTNLTQPTQHYALRVDTNGVVVLPDQSIINGSTLRAVAGSYAGLTTDDGENSWMWVDANGAYIATQYNESGNSHQWTFDNTGNLTLPSNISSINYANGQPYGSSGNAAGNAGDIQINVAGGLGADSTLRYVDNGGEMTLFADYLNAPGIFTSDIYAGDGTPSNITLTTSYGNATWTFDTIGSLTLPGGSRLRPLGANLDIFAGTGSYVNLITSDESTAVGVGGGGGYITTAGGTWDFGTDGALTLPASSGQIGRSGYTDGIDLYNNNGTGYVRMNYADESLVWADPDGAHVQTTGGTWDFDTTGNLTVPGNIIMTTGIVGSGASPAPYLSGFDSVSAVTLSASGNVTGGNVNTGAIRLTNGATIKNTVGNAIAIGYQAGNSSQGNYATAIGFGAGGTNQGTDAIAIGGSAGNDNQRSYAISVGYLAGQTVQGTQSVAIGLQAGTFTQGYTSVALGAYAGRSAQGTSAVAIGYLAGNTSQANNSIILNATGAVLDQTTANTFTVAPVRNDVANTAQVLFYNTTSKEVTYGNTVSVAGNVTAANFFGNGNTLSNIPTQTTGSWTLAAGTNTVTLTVPGPGTYSIWVNGNIPNGIVTYTATVVVTNNNVPVVGSSYGWYYAAGNALVLTAIPTQIVGTVNNISNAVVVTTTANVFEFGITNNSGNSAVVNYGYTKL